MKKKKKKVKPIQIDVSAGLSELVDEAIKKGVGFKEAVEQVTGTIKGIAEEKESGKENAKVRIKCRCGNVFIALIPLPLIRQWQIHKCTQCPQRFKSCFEAKELGGKGWSIFAEGQICDKCYKARPVRDAVTRTGPSTGKVYHLCQSCFDKGMAEALASGGPIEFTTYTN